MFAVPRHFTAPCYFSSLQPALGCVPSDPPDRRGENRPPGTHSKKLRKKKTSVSFTKQIICQDSLPNGESRDTEHTRTGWRVGENDVGSFVASQLFR